MFPSFGVPTAYFLFQQCFTPIRKAIKENRTPQQTISVGKGSYHAQPWLSWSVCLLDSPWQRAALHADGRRDGEGGLEGGRIRVRMPGWLLALLLSGHQGPPPGWPPEIPGRDQATGQLCESLWDSVLAHAINAIVLRIIENKRNAEEDSCFLLREVSTLAAQLRSKDHNESKCLMSPRVL